MIVVDASVLANMLLYPDGCGHKARSVLARDIQWAAPEHWKAELFSAIRGLALGNKIGEGQAARAVERLPRLGVDHVPLDKLLPRMWQLRSAVSAYDVAYVALAQERNLTLVTSDARLARGAMKYCRVELVL